MTSDYERNLLRDLEFHCPVCRMVVRPPMDSQVVRAYLGGLMERDTALEVLRGAHERHQHTSYDGLRAAVARRLRHEGVPREEARSRARETARLVLDREGRP